MSKLQQALAKEGLTPEAREAFLADADVVRELQDVANVAKSDGGKVLRRETKENCKEILATLINEYRDASEAKLRSLIAEFAANYKLFNTLLSAPSDYSEASKEFDDRLGEFLEG
jgi:SOS response regulatory protein OraA/RecX